MTLPPLYLLLVAVVGVFAGTVNTIAGGGSLITLPALIFLGVPPTVANGTNRVGVMVQSFTASASYHRRGMVDWRRAIRLLGPISVGTLVGAWALAAQVVLQRLAMSTFPLVGAWALAAQGVLEEIVIIPSPLVGRRS